MRLPLSVTPDRVIFDNPFQFRLLDNGQLDVLKASSLKALKHLLLNSLTWNLL